MTCSPSCTHYAVVRMFKSGRRSRAIAMGLTLQEAQAHCNDPETSSSTAQGSKARAYTRRNGDWFDGYEHRHKSR